MQCNKGKEEMAKLIELPHAVHESTCYINGLFDTLAGNGAKYDYYLLCIIGGMSSFSYLKFKMSNPPCLVYWGNSPRYLLKQLEEIIGFKQTISEGKAFKNEFPRIKKYLDANIPVMAGALDMYYLNYYPELYRKEHIPIHYVLIVGYDDEKQTIYIHDCSYTGIKQVSYKELEDSLNVNVPGMSKKNTYRVFSPPQTLPTELEIAEKGLAYTASRMLKPPVNMIGIPAMRKLAKEIINWDNKDCFNHMAAYAGLTPPLIAADLSHNDGMRFEKARVLEEIGKKYRRERWENAASLFIKSGELIIQLSGKAVKQDGKGCSALLTTIADTEEKAFELLR
jgi:hypothetical protein